MPTPLPGALGLVGSALLVIGTLAPPEGARQGLPGLLRPLQRLVEGHPGIPFALGGLALVTAWLMVRPRGDSPHEPARLLRLGLLWGAPLVLALPLGSKDAYLYLDQGWQLTQGVDPYASGLTASGGPFAPYVSDYWAGSTAVYPPLALRVAQLAVEVGHAHTYWSVVALRIPLVLALLALALLAPRLARAAGGRAGYAAWLGPVNPAFLVAGVAGLHHDAVLAGLLVVALWCARLPRGLLWGAVALGVAAAVKQPAVVLGPAVVLAAQPHRLSTALAGASRPTPSSAAVRQLAARLAAAGLVGALAFAAVSLLTGLGFGWTRALSVPAKGESLAPVLWLWRLGRPLVGGAYDLPPALGSVAQLVGLAALPVIVWVCRDGRWARCAWLSLLAFALCGASLWPWYLVPVAVLIGIDRLGPRGRAAGVALSVGVVVAQLVMEGGGYGMDAGVPLGGALALAAGAAAYLMALRQERGVSAEQQARA
ncbi:MAG: polyprenol phosphomannose-dependent alpha 1,6 mannosyltransferase MptB [Micrococcales bacterium]|nr:polyprenol phosphomannose-dependent alpha 1,6 mannosyltransferase MptB [Micrococcales bacterium]